jgi:hypothetical protein
VKTFIVTVRRQGIEALIKDDEHLLGSMGSMYARAGYPRWTGLFLYCVLRRGAAEIQQSRRAATHVDQLQTRFFGLPGEAFSRDACTARPATCIAL